MKTLLYLQIRLFLNSLKSITTSPKKLIPAILIAIWFLPGLGANLLVLLNPAYQPSPPEMLGGPLGADAVWSIIFVVLTLVSVSIVWSALSEGLLIFTPAHVDFLFPTPIERRCVLTFKLAGDYLKLSLYSAFFFVFLGPLFGSILGRVSLSDMLVGWAGAVLLLIFVMNISHALHISVAQGIDRLSVAGRIVKLATLAIILAIAATVWFYYLKNGDALTSITAALRIGFPRFALAPVAWATNLIVGPAAGNSYNALWSLLWLSLLAAGSLVALLARPENFYEPSLAISARMAQMRAARQTGNIMALRIEAIRRKGKRGYTSSSLRPFGQGATAILWKSLAVRVRAHKKLLVCSVVLPPVIIAGLARVVNDREILSILPLALAYVAVIFTMMAQTELRSELTQANILKAMPLSGFSVMAAQSFAAWLPIVPFVLSAGIPMLLFIPGINPLVTGLSVVGSLSLGFIFIVAAFIPALLYPDCRDHMQQVIPDLLTMLCIGLTMIPSIVTVAVLIILRVRWEIIACVITALNIALAWGLIAIAGALFDRFDPTSG